MANERPVALVTGASRGIGLHVARGLRDRGFEVWGVARSSPAERADANASLRWLNADLSAMNSVRALADGIAQSLPRIDVLVHNAAVVEPRRTLTVDGFERQMAVNHLAVYLLTCMLMPLIRRSRAARIVITASQVERGAQLDFDDLMSARCYEPDHVYARTKLANVMFTYELARRLAGTVVCVNCLHPGVVRTSLLDELLAAEAGREPSLGWAMSMAGHARAAAGGALRALGLRPPVTDWALSPMAGAATTLHVATDPRLAHVSGRYFSECEICESSPQSLDRRAQSQLWDASAELLGVSAQWPVAAGPRRLLSGDSI